jgi:DNA/RNA endonuclease YhcR with UshA esterase domain
MKLNIPLLPLCLGISLIGIIILLFISTTQPSQINIEQINSKLLNKKVQVQGSIFNIRSFEDSNFQIISIKDGTGKIDITTNKILNLENNQKIIVIGKITTYKEFLQIQADKIITVF